MWYLSVFLMTVHAFEVKLLNKLWLWFVECTLHPYMVIWCKQFLVVQSLHYGEERQMVPGTWHVSLWVVLVECLEFSRLLTTNTVPVSHCRRRPAAAVRPRLVWVFRFLLIAWDWVSKKEVQEDCHNNTRRLCKSSHFKRYLCWLDCDFQWH